MESARVVHTVWTDQVHAAVRDSSALGQDVADRLAQVATWTLVPTTDLGSDSAVGNPDGAERQCAAWHRHLLAFDCFLRVGELVGLRKKDVADTGDRRMGSEYHGTSLRLKNTKTGPNQWVQVNDEQVIGLLRCVVESTGRDSDRLFPFSAAKYRSVFKATCAELGLSHRYVPHSLRHGGATRWHLLGHPIEDVLLRGRWSSVKSARRYVQAGRALLLKTAVPASLAGVAKLLSDNLLVSFALSLSR
jgi:integrase